MGWIAVLHCHINCLQHNINAKGIKPAIKSNRTSTLKEILRNLESPARNSSQIMSPQLLCLDRVGMKANEVPDRMLSLLTRSHY